MTTKMEARNGSAVRSPSRSKRSTTNLADLRLAPLSTKFAVPAQDHSSAKSPYDEAPDYTFARQHSSYLQGKSAPSTPGILSRSSSRRHNGGGLSRRDSLYHDDAPYQYSPAVQDLAEIRTDVGSGQIPRAKSEAALLVEQKLSGPGVSAKRNLGHVRSRTGTHITIPKTKSSVDDDWLSRTRTSANALVQEAKGQSWLASRDSLIALTQLDSDDDDDEGYEEMAALSASHAKLQGVSNAGTPSSAQVRSPIWGSRYGSRSASRRGSLTNVRSPLGTSDGREGMTGYFDGAPLTLPTEPDFVDPEDGDDEKDVSKLAGRQSLGLGGIVDTLVGFNLFNVEERDESTDDETERGDDTEDEAKERMVAEARRKREEKVKLTSPPPAPPDRTEAGEGGIWKDAAWLLSVASKVIF